MNAGLHHYNVEQGSPEWHAMRVAKVTASRISDVMASGKGGAASISRERYLAELATERLTGLPYPHYKSASMERGNEAEADSVARYEIVTGNLVQRVAFVDHPTIPMSGASPDGLVGDDGLVEAKNGDTHTHYATLFGASVPIGYMRQCQWQMACTGREWCDLMSCDARQPDWLQLKIIRIPRDEVMIADISREVIRFLRELDELTERLRGMK